MKGRPTVELQSVERLSDRQTEDLHRLYQNEWWSKGRTLEDVRRMIENTEVVIGLVDLSNGRLIGFARAITDRVYKALILDAIVDLEFRAEGLGRRLVDEIVAHPSLAGVADFELYCAPEMVPFYERWGFSAELGELKFMRLSRTDSIRTETQ